LFNEGINWLLLVSLQGYTGDLFDPEKKYSLGWYSGALMAGYLLTHLVNYFRTQALTLHGRYKVKQHLNKVKKHLEQKAKEVKVDTLKTPATSPGLAQPKKKKAELSQGSGHEKGVNNQLLQDDAGVARELEELDEIGPGPSIE
jgi:hypothetical protein